VLLLDEDSVKIEIIRVNYVFTIMSTNIYILKLQGCKYYIGKSENLMKRYHEHLSGKGATWTKKYKPISIEKIIEKVSHFDEDTYTIVYMAKYGIENVRGGTYVSIQLDETQEDALNREIRSAKNYCTECGRKGHFMKDCYAKTDVCGNELVYEEELEELWSCEYCDAEFSDEEDCDKHERKCHRKKKDYCYRCGREGHYSPDCYASTHRNGYILD
jgi:hypothetical protein